MKAVNTHVERGRGLNRRVRVPSDGIKWMSEKRISYVDRVRQGVSYVGL